MLKKKKVAVDGGQDQALKTLILKGMKYVQDMGLMIKKEIVRDFFPLPLEVEMKKVRARFQGFGEAYRRISDALVDLVPLYPSAHAEVIGRKVKEVQEARAEVDALIAILDEALLRAKSLPTSFFGHGNVLEEVKQNG